jgi:hypothetical protein
MVMVFAGLIMLVSAMPRHELSGTWLTLLRVCFPSWRFFGEPGVQVQLLWRASEDDPSESSWRPAMRTATRSIGFLVWNPQATMRLSEESVVRDAVADINALDEPSREQIEDLTSFRLLRALAEASIGIHLASGEDPREREGPLHYELLVRSRAATEAEFGDHLHVPAHPYLPEKRKTRASK